MWLHVLVVFLGRNDVLEIGLAIGFGISSYSIFESLSFFLAKLLIIFKSDKWDDNNRILLIINKTIEIGKFLLCSQGTKSM
jgi:hypothetical protein